MYADIVLDIESPHFLSGYTYHIPEIFQEKICLGMRVKVPFGKRSKVGYVHAIKEQAPDTSIHYKDIQELLDMTKVLEPFYIDFIKKISSYYFASPYDVYKHILPAWIPFGLLSVDGRISVKKLEDKKIQTWYSVAKMTDDDAKKLLLRAPKQQVIYEYIKEHGEVEERNFLQFFPKDKVALKKLCEKGLLNIDKKYSLEQVSDVSFSKNVSLQRHWHEKQKYAIESISHYLMQNQSKLFLLEGVTGSGKTEVYIELARRTVSQKGQVLFLVPEIGLAEYTLQRVLQAFPDKEVRILHSDLSDEEKLKVWLDTISGKTDLLLGTRSASFIPFKNLQLILMDEAHDASYKQSDQTPRYHTQKVVYWRASYEKIVAVFGTATPDISLRYGIDHNDIELITMPERIQGAEQPNWHIVDMRSASTTPQAPLISVALQQAIEKRLQHKEQSILFLNRRGYASFIQCNECGHVLMCPHCDVAETYHASLQQLVCHYCQHHTAIPQCCPVCGSPKLGSKTWGTEAVVAMLKKAFPHGRIARLDTDITKDKKAYRSTIQSFLDRKTDILVGTQMIAKGLDLPAVTLVGILQPDQMLHMADFKGTEKAYQLFSQVAGRSGRSLKKGEVYFQTYSPENPLLPVLMKNDYEAFYAQELERRRALLYPPFVDLVRVLISDPDENLAQKGIMMVYAWLKEHKTPEVEILGPGEAPIKKVQNRFRYQLYLRSSHTSQLEQVVLGLRERFLHKARKKTIRVIIDRDPEIMM